MSGEAWPPEHARLLVSFDVAGEPKGAGSKDAVPLGRWRVIGGQRRFVAILRENGVPIVNVIDSAGKAGESWSAEVRAACALALDAAHEMFDGPIAIEAVFYTERPRTHFGTGRNGDVVKDSAPELPFASRLPDGTKLMRRLEDALNGLAYADDRRIVDSRWSRRYGKPRTTVTLWKLPQRSVQSRAPLFDVAD